MARYIDADALLEKLKKLREFWEFTFTADGVDEAIDEVEEAPDADVVPKTEVAREIFAEIYDYLHDRITKHYEIITTKYSPEDKMLFDECEFIRDKILKPIEKKYTGGGK